MPRRKPTLRHTPGGAALTGLILETFRLNGRLLSAGDRLVKDLDLTSARWQLLGAVAMAPQAEPVPHLARRMGLVRQGVQRLADELAAEGLLRFAPNPHHKRAKLLLLTEKGRAAYAEASRLQILWANELAEGLPPSGLRDAAAAMGRIRARWERGG
jgi:DNA-binding MarR family transcriptional regulator